MLDVLTPICSATSTTDRPRLIRASRRWRARLGLRGNALILVIFRGKQTTGSDVGSASVRASQIVVINPSKRIPTMRYYEIAQRPKAPTAIDQIVRDERNLQHDAWRILPSGESLRMSGNAAKAKPHSAATANHHAPAPHPGRYGRVL
jgi:hypothetical protein